MAVDELERALESVRSELAEIDAALLERARAEAAELEVLRAERDQASARLQAVRAVLEAQPAREAQARARLEDARAKRLGATGKLFAMMVPVTATAFLVATLAAWVTFGGDGRVEAATLAAGLGAASGLGLGLAWRRLRGR